MLKFEDVEWIPSPPDDTTTKSYTGLYRGKEFLIVQIFDGLSYQSTMICYIPMEGDAWENLFCDKPPFTTLEAAQKEIFDAWLDETTQQLAFITQFTPGEIA